MRPAALTVLFVLSLAALPAAPVRAESPAAPDVPEQPRPDAAASADLVAPSEVFVPGSDAALDTVGDAALTADGLAPGECAGEMCAGDCVTGCAARPADHVGGGLSRLALVLALGALLFALRRARRGRRP